jgi:hypothetical protein
LKFKYHSEENEISENDKAKRKDLMDNNFAVEDEDGIYDLFESEDKVELEDLDDVDERIHHDVPDGNS